MRLRFTTMGVAIATLAFGSLAVTTAPASAQDAPTVRNEQADAQLAAGTAILAELNSGLDSKKLKAGDKVIAHATEAMKSTDGRTIMPRGTKLEGHVTQAEARNKGGNASTLGIQFDKATLRDGGEIALNVVLQAMAPRQVSGPVGADDAGPTTIGTNQTSPMSGGHTPPPNASPQSGGAGGGPGVGPAAVGPQLDKRSRGAVGMKGITLDAQAVDGRAATLISSNGKSVKLDEGTQVLLVVQEKKSEATPQ